MAEQRLIDVNEAIEIAKEYYWVFERSKANLTDLREVLKDCTTIEAKPVVHAHWTGSDGTHCSHCKRSYMDVADADSYESGDIPDFCPYCGAQMDEEVNDNERD